MKFEDIKNVGVVGGGTMGHGIALNYALHGYTTFINDVNDDILKQSKKNVEATLALFVEEELITRQQADSALSLISTPENNPIPVRHPVAQRVKPQFSTAT